MTTTQPDSMTKDEGISVTQADRIAAADLENWERDDSKRHRFLSGEFDGTFAVQAFARHRLAHSTPGDAEVRKALAWALPLAERAVDDHRMERIRCGHTNITGTYSNGQTWVGIHQSEVDQIEAARQALATPSGRAQEQTKGDEA